MVKGVGHIGILVRNLDETLQLYQDLFGAKPGEVETVAEQGVKTVLVDVGGTTKLEFLEPLPESNMAKALEKRGEGLHHICLEVDNVDQSLDSLASKGVELIDKKARRGLEGMIAFVHPKSLKGVLIELCQTV
jgi:methylmalonyl-CoA epimerase